MAALQQQVTIDALTGLGARRAFDGALETALRRPVPGATDLVLIDVDSFTSIDDTDGYPVGTTCWSPGQRAGDDDAVLSRLGGDEVAILMPGCGRAGRSRTGVGRHELTGRGVHRSTGRLR